jgi:hypothetical protein
MSPIFKRECTDIELTNIIKNSNQNALIDIQFKSATTHSKPFSVF